MQLHVQQGGVDDASTMLEVMTTFFSVAASKGAWEEKTCAVY